MKHTRRQKLAIPFLITCTSVSEAAAASGVGESTLRAWLKNPDFAAVIDALLDENIRDSVQQIGAELSKLGPLAVKKIKEILDGTQKSDSEILLRAANSAIDRLLKVGALRSSQRIPADLEDERETS